MVLSYVEFLTDARRKVRALNAELQQVSPVDNSVGAHEQEQELLEEIAALSSAILEFPEECASEAAEVGAALPREEQMPVFLLSVLIGAEGMTIEHADHLLGQALTETPGLADVALRATVEHVDS